MMKCTKCGDESNSEPYLRCGRSLGLDANGEETRPPYCDGVYLPIAEVGKPMKMIATLCLVIIAACGSDAALAPDAVLLDDGGNPIPPDGPPSPTNLVNVPLDCVESIYEIHNAATDNSRERSIVSWAITDIAPGSDFVLTRCDAPSPPPVCQSGDVCSGELEPPATTLCSVSRGSGNFYDGRLRVHCGTRTERISGSGVLTVTSQTTFTVKLEIFQ